MADSKIILDSINYSYKNDRDFAIKDLNLVIPENTITCILGQNGVGKTTLLLLIMGYLKPSAGNISLFNKESEKKEEQDIQNTISYLQQYEELPMNLSVMEYILLGRLPFISPLSIPNQIDIEYVSRHMQLLDIDGLRNSNIGKISGGELQRVRLCRALAQESDLILLDEPITHLDIKSKYAIMKLIKNLKSIGKTIVFTSHDPIEALQISDRSILIYSNQHLIFGETKEIINSKNLSNCLNIPINIILNKTGYAYQVQSDL